MTGEELNRLAGGIRGIATSMRHLGVDIGFLETTAAAFQLFSGVGQAVKGLIAAKQAYNVIRAAEGAAQLHLVLVLDGLVVLAAGVTRGLLHLRQDAFQTWVHGPSPLRAYART